MPWNDKKIRPKPCLGRQLIKAKNNSRSGDSVATSQRHTEELNDGYEIQGLNLESVDKDTDMNTFLETAAAAAQEYEGIRRDIKLIDTNPKVSRVAPKAPVPPPDVDPLTTGSASVTSDTKSEQEKATFDTKNPSLNKFEDKLNQEFFAPPISTLHKQGDSDLPSTLPPKGWKKSARVNKHVKTKRLYPRE